MADNESEEHGAGDTDPSKNTEPTPPVGDTQASVEDQLVAANSKAKGLESEIVGLKASVEQEKTARTTAEGKVSENATSLAAMQERLTASEGEVATLKTSNDSLNTVDLERRRAAVVAVGASAESVANLNSDELAVLEKTLPGITAKMKIPDQHGFGTGNGNGETADLTAREKISRGMEAESDTS
ncbi:hypothetical protein LCGC14_1908940 [marine sediment metagenome]|uniref:Uncharacterized protein n=1 Tax=marine sediment metagenome TaxID=412755 RepID=A0A0F9GHH2_9ZZZZ